MDTFDNGGSQRAAATPTPRRTLLLRGITWSAAFQVLEVILSFGAMLVLVRIIPVGDYGRAAAVVGILGFLNLFNVHLFFEHAIQLPDDREPDWNLHWTYGFYLQTSLAMVCHAVAGLCWFSAAYRPIAPLLHIAACGLLLDWPSQFGAVMLRRALDLRRLRVVAAVGIVLRLLTTLALAVAGKGAYAIVIGNNFVTAIPFGVDLLLIRGWRPAPGWWRPPVWQRYAAERRFGVQRAGSNLVGGFRSALEAAVLPAPLGFAALGLLSRAQAFYGTSIGRLGSILNDAAYPFLPRVAHQRERFASYATTYLQVLLLISIPGALFVGQQGPVLSRVLYGTKWVAMDPLIWPGALIGLSLAVFSTASSVVMAAGRLRACLVLDAVFAVTGALALIVAYITRATLPYSWALAAGELGAAAIGIWWASRLLDRRWFRRAVVPPVAAALAGLAVAQVSAPPVIGERPALELLTMTALYFSTCFVVLRFCFKTALNHLLDVVPAGDRLRGLVRLSPGQTEDEVPTIVMPILRKEAEP
jgi:O-antigen/teichoic acid export membrane protein